MAVDQKEVERIVDDFETKLEHLNDLHKSCMRMNDHWAAGKMRSKAEGIEYCLAVLRQVTP